MKPARDFTIHKRAANKFAFRRRKNLWDTVTCMIAHGFTLDTAIDRIYLVYGRGSLCAPSAMLWLKTDVTKLIGCYELLFVCFFASWAWERPLGGWLGASHNN